MFYFFVSLTESYHRTAVVEVHVDWNRVAQEVVVLLAPMVFLPVPLLDVHPKTFKLSGLE